MHKQATGRGDKKTAAVSNAVTPQRCDVPITKTMSGPWAHVLVVAAHAVEHLRGHSCEITTDHCVSDHESLRGHR
jgi:hypothetical protein